MSHFVLSIIFFILLQIRLGIDFSVEQIKQILLFTILFTYLVFKKFYFQLHCGLWVNKLYKKKWMNPHEHLKDLFIGYVTIKNYEPTFFIS